jgi:Icc protein
MSARRADHLENGSGALQVLQLSDTHLYSDAEGRLLGQKTRQTLELVLDLIPIALASLDLVLLTGDLVHDESPEGYRYLKERMATLGSPCHCLPGNHDNSSIMADIFESGQAKMGTSVQLGRWNLVLLDSTMPGKDGGHLDREQLGHLQDSLASRPDDPALVCLHHQPVPVGSIWMDTMALDNPDEFFGIIDHHPQVRAVLWGHVHQEFSGERKGVRLLGSPSTCVQFLPGTRDFALDTRTPGLRWLRLYGDGRIDTGVERIASYPDPLGLTTSGY